MTLDIVKVGVEAEVKTEVVVEVENLLTLTLDCVHEILFCPVKQNYPNK
jgi:hypothetical protein